MSKLVFFPCEVRGKGSNGDVLPLGGTVSPQGRMSRILGPRDGFQAAMSAPTPGTDLLLSSVTEVWPAGSMNDEGPTRAVGLG